MDVEGLQDLSAEELMRKKESLEAEIRTHNDFLEAQSGVGMKGRLVDDEGFPRSDIDVYGVRTSRNRIICLRNDHKAVMAAVEAKLHEIHAEARERQKSEEAGSGVAKEAESTQGFARINDVTQGSPADAAGLMVDDVLIEFGSLTGKNFRSLQDVATVVQNSQQLTLSGEGKMRSPFSRSLLSFLSSQRRVRVVVSRRGARVVLSLLPRRWAGRGLLGCNVVSL